MMKSKTLQDFEADVRTAMNSSLSMSQSDRSLQVNNAEWNPAQESETDLIQKIDFQQRNQFARGNNYYSNNNRFPNTHSTPFPHFGDSSSIVDRLTTVENQMREVKANISKIEPFNRISLGNSSIII